MKQEAIKSSQVAIIGAGPIGIELAIALKQAQVQYLQFDKGQVAQMVYNFPIQTRFFSSTERIGIAGIPIQTVDQQKCSREEYLAYMRTVVSQFQLKINSYENVIAIEKQKEGFLLKTSRNGRDQYYLVTYLVFATGGTSSPRMLHIPGEDLPHVNHKFEDPHKYFQKNLVIIGGRNSAVEWALRCFQAKAQVTLINRDPNFDAKSIKYWLMPELLGRMERKEIHCYFNSEAIEIFNDGLLLKDKLSKETISISCDFVLKAIGFDADMHLLREVGVSLSDSQQAPHYDLKTMETTVENVYVLGTVVGGTQKRYRVFIENTHAHVSKIAASLSKKMGISIHVANHLEEFGGAKTFGLEE